MAKYSDIDDFKEYELYPALFESLNIIFPRMDFRKDKGDWKSTYHLNGVQDSGKKFVTYAYANSKKHLIQDLATGDKPNLIDFYMSYYGFGEDGFRDAVNELSSKLGLASPYMDSEIYEQYRKRKKEQDDKRTALKAFTSALWSGSPEAKEVLDYLHSRNWSDEEIKQAQLGLVTAAIINTLPDRRGFYSSSTITDENGNKKEVGRIGTTHTLAIPLEQGSRLVGFKVREARDELITPDKYLNVGGLHKTALFGIGIGIETAIIVESELDALLAQAKGIPSVAATAGGAISRAQLEEALKRGVKRLILLYDNDKAGRGFTLETKLDNKGKKIAEKGTIPLCEELGIPTYVVSLPSDVKDVNDFFQKGHTSKELSELINKARPSYLYRYSLVRKKYADIYDERVKAQQGDEEEATLTYIERDAFLEEVGEIINDLSIMGHAGNRELIYNELEQVKDSLLFGMDGYREFMDRAYYRKIAKLQLEELKAAADKIQALAQAGKADEARKFMRETVEAADLQDNAAEHAKVFSPPSRKEYDTIISEIGGGLPTGYCFEKGTQREALTLNVGLTFLCGLRGHGKTTFLNNIAINEVTRQLDIENKGGKAKSVLYFSYEINKGLLIRSLLNTFVNDPELSSRPLDTIKSYFDIKTGKVTTYWDRETKELRHFTDPETGAAHYFAKGEFIDEDGNRKTHFSHFKERDDLFYRNYIESGLLTIIDKPYTAEKLLDEIKQELSLRPVSLVCIDYAQQIYSEAAKSKARYEEIKKIVNDIKNFANEKNLPFVMAAQFNRKDVKSPVSVDTTSIGEGGDFERIADTCIGIYNLKELRLPMNSNDYERSDLKSFLKDNKNKARINHILKLRDPKAAELPDGYESSPSPIEGVMYVRLMKRRYGAYPLDTFLQWEGKTGHIKQNDEEHFKNGSIEASLFTYEAEQEEDLPPF